ncbi:MAG TPA: hypothetical protein VNW29_05235 [Candidatus Sulfotelmatobacter sp.]|jgi:hypothetical protein|nr:hypothetical protein [Candidatus Sulfotelmatobacter sp.]
MSETVKIIASTTATCIAAIAYIPYLIDMFKGKNKPHLYTWISIFLITAIVAYIQLVSGSGVGAIPIILGVFVDAIILFYCFKFGTKDVVFIDKICLAISIVGVISYPIFITRPIIALLFVTIAEVISFIPTVRKTRNDPYSESLTSYYLIMVKLILILIALQTYNILTVSYSVLWLVVFILFLSITYYWRTGKKSSRYRGSDKSIIIPV